MTFAKRRFLWGTEKILTPSRFLKELPKEHIAGNEISIKNEVSIEAQDGSRVSHRTFGKGFIVKVYETSYGVTYDVVFDSDLQTRTLVAKYAKLTVL